MTGNKDLDLRGTDILAMIQWAPGTDPDTVAAVEAAVLDLDRQVYGTNQKVIGPAQLYLLLMAYIAKHGGPSAAARKLGIAKSFLCDIENARRPPPPAVIRKLGFEKLPPKDRFAEL